MIHTRRAVATIALAMTPSFVLAQRQKEPQRPKLPAGADTNSARVYFGFALQELRRDPEKAANALYWATRLEPTFADAFYARRVALLLSDMPRLRRYWSGDRRTVQSDEIRRIDSLYYFALTINPFVSQRLDHELYEAIADDIARRYSDAGVATASEVRYAIDREMQSAPAAMRAEIAYGEGDDARALSLYADAVKSDKKNSPLRIDRARIFYNRNQPDSSLAELNAAVEDLRTRDKKELVYVYQSKAIAEQSLGVLHQRLGHRDQARDAFGRALQEDLSFYPAHVQLGFMALEARDTTTALAEMDLATQLRPDDAAAQYTYGFTLAAVGHLPDAEVHLRKAIELNPVFAAPHFSLGEVLEATMKVKEALAEYQSFLAHAPQTDPRREDAEQRAAILASAIKSGSDR